MTARLNDGFDRGTVERLESGAVSKETVAGRSRSELFHLSILMHGVMTERERWRRDTAGWVMIDHEAVDDRLEFLADLAGGLHELINTALGNAVEGQPPAFEWLEAMDMLHLLRGVSELVLAWWADPDELTAAVNSNHASRARQRQTSFLAAHQ